LDLLKTYRENGYVVHNKGKTKYYYEPLRRVGEKCKGELNGAWNGGSSYFPYGIEFNHELKEFIRNRDDRICQRCGKDEKENKHRLSIHHIDYDKKNNDVRNLITLCGKCHAKTNSKRDNWKRYFQKLHELRYSPTLQETVRDKQK
jgi:hypothetical protein